MRGTIVRASHASAPKWASAYMTAAPITPAATSSRTTPQPPGRFSSSQRTGGGLTMSSTRNTTKPTASGAQWLRSTNAIGHQVAGDLVDHDPAAVVRAPGAVGARAAAQIPSGGDRRATTIANCHIDRPASAQASGTATAVPQVPGATGE